MTNTILSGATSSASKFRSVNAFEAIGIITKLIAIG
jgi:hypothetical protein